MSLDETLGAGGVHLCRVEREKLAARAAALKAMDARKQALIEASWCRIIKLAGLVSLSISRYPYLCYMIMVLLILVHGYSHDIVVIVPQSEFDHGTVHSHD